MKKFVFRFQTLLDTKKHHEELLENDLAILMKKHIEQQSLLEEARAELLSHREQCANCKEGLVEDIRRHRDFYEKLQDDIRLREEAVSAAASEVQSKRSELVELRRERLALEKLREKDHAKYQRELAMWERKFLDEIAAHKYARLSAGKTN